MDFRGIAERFLAANGYAAHPCDSEEEARGRVDELAPQGRWPCYFFTSDTTGEKALEEFRMAGEEVDLDRYDEIGVVRWAPLEDAAALTAFVQSLRDARAAGSWTREQLIEGLEGLLPEFAHQETGRFLDARM